MPSAKVFVASAIAFLTSSNAHMILKTPPPYGSPNSSPLEPSGANFPCKATTNTGGPVTEMPIGSSQELSFTGSAVHGGGSCQVALTKDSPATKDSKWQVIHSIVGGCPSKQAAGNLPENANGDGADKYTYKIPAGIAPSTYTLAWTWFNQIGNREMYMNCASVKVTGGAAKRDTYHNETYAIPELDVRDTSFPDLFKANIPTSDCVTAEGGPVDIPNPGSSVDKFGSGKAVPPTGPKCGGTSADGAGGASNGQSAGQASGSNSGSAQAPAQAPPSPPSTSPAGTPSGGGVDVMANPGSSSPSAATGSEVSSPAPMDAKSPSSGSSSSADTAPASVPAPVAPVASASAPSAPAAGSTSTCNTAGQSICSADKKSIGTCDVSLKAVMIPVPAGTECRDGQIQWPSTKRSRLFARGYVRKHQTVNWGF